MRILCIGDLHIWNDDIIADYSRIVNQMGLTDGVDVIVICGDIVESKYLNFLPEVLRVVFTDKNIPIVCCLGNHEFFHNTFYNVMNTMEYWDSNFVDNNIHLLDFNDSYIIGEFNFCGGCLFYDGSMKYTENQILFPFNGWKDELIRDITNYRSFCEYYLQNIDMQHRVGYKNILVTHCVPHERLNTHEPSEFNYYTGVKNALEKLFKFDYCICGHTHRRTIGLDINDTLCVNPGAFSKFQHYVLEI